MHNLTLAERLENLILDISELPLVEDCDDASDNEGLCECQHNGQFNRQLNALKADADRLRLDLNL